MQCFLFYTLNRARMGFSEMWLLNFLVNFKSAYDSLINQILYQVCHAITISASRMVIALSSFHHKIASLWLTFWARSQIFVARVFGSIVLFGWCQWPNVPFIDTVCIWWTSIWCATIRLSGIGSAMAFVATVMLLVLSRRFIRADRCCRFHRWHCINSFIRHRFSTANTRLLWGHRSAILLVCFFFFHGMRKMKDVFVN